MIYRFDTFELDIARAELRNRGEVIAVEPQVFNLLVLLVENPDRLVSREEIIEKIWNGRIVSESAIDSRIKASRQAIDDNGRDQRLIKTLRGRGIRFVGDVQLVSGAGSKAVTDQQKHDAEELELPDKPSIAVLPFDNMSSDPEQEFLADGMCEDILTALSKVPQLFVIARNSSFVYKGKKVDMRTLGRELGVRYILEGSVRSSSENLRITAQLIDTKLGKHIWAERYDRVKQDVFALQDTITQQIVSSLLGELTNTKELTKLWAGGTTNFDAWQALVEAHQLMVIRQQRKIIAGREMAEKAIQHDPQYASAYVTVAYSHFMQMIQGWSDNPMESLGQIQDNARKALDIVDTESFAWAMLAFVTLVSGNREEGLKLADKAITLGPNVVDTINLVAVTYVYCGKYEEAAALCRHAERLIPIGESTVAATSTLVYTVTGEYADAIRHAEDIVRHGSAYIDEFVCLTVCHQALGEEAQAQEYAKKIRDIDPAFSVNAYLAAKFVGNSELGQTAHTNLLAAGFPE